MHRDILKSPWRWLTLLVLVLALGVQGAGAGSTGGTAFTPAGNGVSVRFTQFNWLADDEGVTAVPSSRAGVAKGSHTLENRIRRGSVAVYPLGVAVFVEAIVDVSDDARDQDPLAGFRRVYTSRYYAVYANC